MVTSMNCSGQMGRSLPNIYLVFLVLTQNEDRSMSVSELSILVKGDGFKFEAFAVFLTIRN